jgi:hypothetical protein
MLVDIVVRNHEVIAAKPTKEDVPPLSSFVLNPVAHYLLSNGIEMKVIAGPRGLKTGCLVGLNIVY